MEAVEASKPTQIAYGKVTSASPLKVKVSEKLILTSEVLVVPEHLKDHEVTLKDQQNVETKYTMKSALKTGDKVVMLRNRGGQKYLILDRMVSE